MPILSALSAAESLTGDGAQESVCVSKSGAHLFQLFAIRRWLVVFVLAFAVVVVDVSPSMAACCKPCCSTALAAAQKEKTVSEKSQWLIKFEKWSENFKLLKTIIDVFDSILGFFKKIFHVTDDKLGVLIAETHVENIVKSEIQTKKHEDENITTAATAINKQIGKEVMEKTEGDASDTAACNRIVAGQGPAVMYPFAIFCENVVTAGTESLFLNPGADGSGPYYARFAWEMTCPSREAGNPRNRDWPTGDDRRGFSDSCLAPVEDFLSADLTARMISGEIMPLQMPPFVDQEITLPDGKTATVKVPKLDESLLEEGEDPKENALNYEAYMGQQAFLVAWKGCIRSMGPRPTPPTGDKMVSPQGISVLAQWTGLSARQSAFIGQCAKMLCKHTRPSCGQKNGDTTFDGVCANSALACDAAAALGAQLPFSCRAPMTSFQAEYAAFAACMGREMEIANAGSEASRGGATSAYECMHSFNKWKTQLDKERKAFVKAQKALATSGSQFPETRISPSISQ